MSYLKKLKQLGRQPAPIIEEESQAARKSEDSKKKMEPTTSSGLPQKEGPKTNNKNIPKDDIEVDPAIFVALEYEKNLEALNWTLQSDDRKLRFKSFIDDLVERGKQAHHPNENSNSDDEEWETLAEQTLALGDHHEGSEEEGFEDQASSSSSSGSETKKRPLKDRGSDEFEDNINAAFNNRQLNQRIEWPAKIKDHPILSKYSNPTVYEADLLQTIVDIKERQDMKKQNHKQYEVDISNYHKNMARHYPDTETRPAELNKKRQRNTVAARKSRVKSKMCELDLKNESTDKFRTIHEKLIQISKMSLYCNELRKLAGQPVVDDFTEDAVKKVAEWNEKHS